MKRNNTDSLRVLHIVPAPFSDEGIIGGAERYALELARHMAEEVPTTLVTFGERRDRTRIGNLRMRVVAPTFYVKGQKTNPISPSLLREVLHADVIHCHQYHVLSSTLTAFVGKIAGKRVFVSDLGGSGWDISWRIPTERWYRGHLHISQYSRKIAGHEENRRAHVIMGGVDTHKFSPAKIDKDYGVLFVGRILPHKGIDDLVRAMPSDLPLKIIGRPYAPEFLSHLKELSQGKSVSFHHGCNDEGIVEAYRKALCVVLPSVYKSSYNGGETFIPELLGQTLIEGMACGIPAICTNVASMPEVVENGVTGFVVPPNNPDVLREKLLWLKTYPQEAAQMGYAARERVMQHFTWQSVVRRCLEIYKGD